MNWRAVSLCFDDSRTMAACSIVGYSELGI